VTEAGDERARRAQLWAELLATGGPDGVEPKVLRELTIYGGAQGIWVDRARTSAIDGAPKGVTVAILHTGRHYADELAEDSLVYHYPSTNRPPARDASEVQATQTAKQLEIPVFVILTSRKSRSRRNVRRGWVQGWDDDAKQFLVSFESKAAAPPPTAEAEDAFPFELEAGPSSGSVVVDTRPGQPRFKFRTMRYYGPACCVCDLAVPEMLDAAHLKAKRENGSPRNGLVFCASHHRAFDAGLFGIDPATLAVVWRSHGPEMQDLRLTRKSLDHLRRAPHEKALRTRWAAWKSSTAT